MDIKSAVFVRWVAPDESRDELVNEAKARTWADSAEHLLLGLDSGELVLARGGLDGANFEVGGSPPHQTLVMSIMGRNRRVAQVIWHTHPRVTGPSDGDLEALAILGQAESLIFEIGGQKDGTVIRPKPQAGEC